MLECLPKIYEALVRENINIQTILTSEIKISVVVGEDYGELAVRTLHDPFEWELSRKLANL